MKQRKLVIAGLFLLSALATGIILLAQDAPTPAFDVVMQIGQTRPRGIVYNQPYDQLAMTDTQGNLVLVNAPDFSVQHTLYQQVPINAYVFSHDGSYLAVTHARQIDVWDTRTGELDISLEPEGVLEVTGPIYWANDDALLSFNSIVPEPAATRVSENDTTNLPWLWDLPSARREAPSTLPGRSRTYAFFDHRYGFLLGPNDLAIGPLPERLQLIDVANTDLPVLDEIPSTRRERDPIDVWQSLTGDALYVLPQSGNTFVQIDTANRSRMYFQPGREVRSYAEIRRYNDLALSGEAQLIGEPVTTTENALLRLLLGNDYRRSFNYRPVTAMFLDILDPVTVNREQFGILIYLYDEGAGYGVVDLLRPPDVLSMALHPEGTHLAVRRDTLPQTIEVYNIATGDLELTIYPAIPDRTGGRLFAYDPTGDVILSDFERFDSRTGDVLRQDITLSSGFSDYTFTADSTGLVTLRGAEWWLWDIDAADVIRRETIALRGEVIDVEPDASRYLTRRDVEDGIYMEITNITMEAREGVLITPLPDRIIANIIPSPDWRSYIVIYEARTVTPYSPGNEIAIFTIGEGQTQFYAGDDLPAPGGRQYGWVDNQTAYIATNSIYSGQIERVYGVEYNASGLPQCLVDAFPDDWTGWLDIWEQLNAYLRGDTLARLSLRLCDNLPETAEGFVDALTPTPFPYYTGESTPAPAVVAGVPICLTSRFPYEALEFAELWRIMSAGLDEDEIAELEELLCEGLIGSAAGIAPTATPDPDLVAVQLTSTAQALRDNPPTATLDPNAGQTGRMVVMTIDIRTGVRSLGQYIPRRDEELSRSLTLVMDAFERANGFRLDNPTLSPDGSLLAGTNPSGFIAVYQLNTPYDSIAADATGTLSARQTSEPRSVSLRPTATAPFNEIGTARPTLTATVTPTSPPTPGARFAAEDSAADVCEVMTVTPLDMASADYTASGDLLVSLSGERPVPWRLDVQTGDLNPDELLPGCISGGCQMSFNQQWLLVQNETIFVMRIDGSDLQILYEPVERLAFPLSVYWLPDNMIEIQYERYVAGEYSPVLFLMRYDPETQTYGEPFRPYEPVVINELSTETLSRQPGGGPLVMARTSFDTGTGTGYRYYIVDRDTGELDYFARLSTPGALDIELEWHPSGQSLYYTLPTTRNWFVYDVATGEHTQLGQRQRGIWSPNGRYRIDWYVPDVENRLDEGLPLPKLILWDSLTGEIRRFCIPDTGFEVFAGELIWSPDSRYVAFRIQFPVRGDSVLTPTPEYTVTPTPTATMTFEEQRVAAFWHTLVLDIETGSVTDINTEADDLLLWIATGEEAE